MNNNNFLPWVEKYRPLDIQDIISHDQNIETIKKLLENDSLPHLLFYGCPGTGKTSTILALAKKLYGINLKLMVMKLDASDDRGINSVREDIKGFAEKSNMFIHGVRLVILDEADSMTFDAQFALRRIIEKYSESIRFCLICNYENKIIPALRSRCANFRFGYINLEHIQAKLKEIALNENIIIEDNILSSISYLGKGDLRKAINIFQLISNKSNITISECYNTLGVPFKEDIIFIINIFRNKTISFKELYNIFLNLYNNKNYSLNLFITELLLVILDNNICISNYLNLIYELSELEFMLTKSSTPYIYIGYFVSILIENV